MDFIVSFAVMATSLGATKTRMPLNDILWNTKLLSHCCTFPMCLGFFNHSEANPHKEIYTYKSPIHILHVNQDASVHMTKISVYMQQKSEQENFHLSIALILHIIKEIEIIIFGYQVVCIKAGVCVSVSIISKLYNIILKKINNVSRCQLLAFRLSRYVSHPCHSEHFQQRSADLEWLRSLYTHDITNSASKSQQLASCLPLPPSPS